jgi:hypothetical protein
MSKQNRLLPSPGSLVVASESAKASPKAKRRAAKKSTVAAVGAELRSRVAKRVTSEETRSWGRRAWTDAKPIVEVLAFGAGANALDAYAVQKGKGTSLGDYIGKPGAFYDIDLRALVGGSLLAAGLLWPRASGGKGMMTASRAVHMQRAGLGIFGSYLFEGATQKTQKLLTKTADAGSSAPAPAPAAAPGSNGMVVGRIGDPKARIERLKSELREAITKGNYDRALNLEDRIAKLQFGGGRAGKKAEVLARYQMIESRDNPAPVYGQPRVPVTARPLFS